MSENDKGFIPKMYQYLLGKVSTVVAGGSGAQAPLYQYLLGKVSTRKCLNELKEVYCINIY